MASSLSNSANNLSEGLHRVKCKLGQCDKKWEIKYKYRNFFLKYTSFKDDLINTKVRVVRKIVNTSLTQS